MNWENELYNENEKPLDKLVDGYSHTSVFRRIAFVGDSLSSGEFETRDENDKPGYHDLYKYGPVYDEKFKEKFFLYGHMNPSGYILTAKMIDSYIDYIVRHNPEDFKTIGFVGTDIKYKF